jgi:hypothetical protein
MIGLQLLRWVLLLSCRGWALGMGRTRALPRRYDMKTACSWCDQKNTLLLLLLLRAH